MKKRAWVIAAGAVFGSLFATATFSRDLSFGERVRAQEAIERVYYAHQIGTTKSFEQAVPPAVIEKKVRTYIEQSAALDKVWGRAVTGDALRGELERMVRESQLPDRLNELFEALHGDPFLIQECLARPVLVDRIARQEFSFDRTIHVGARRTAEDTYRELVARRIDPAAENPRRHVERLVKVVDETPTRDPELSHAELKAQDFARRRAMAPARVGEIGKVAELPDAFVIQVVLKESAGEASIAHYVVEKRNWNDWWGEVAPGLGDLTLRAVASPKVVLPTRSALAAGPCLADDTWTFRGRPTGRYGHVAVWTGSVMVVWGGGYDGGSVDNTGGRYDPATDTWAPTSTVNAPTPGFDSAVWTGTVMVVWGGYGGGRYDPASDTWASISTTNAPSPGSVVWTGTRMIVWGGVDELGAPISTGSRYDPVADVWTPMTHTDAPTFYYVPSAVWTGTVMLVWGSDYGATVGHGARYDPVSDQWSAISSDGPSPRYDQVAVWTGSRMLVWGGVEYSELFFGDGKAYDPVSNTWSTMSDTGAPEARAGATAIWTGSRMVVWGGYGYGGSEVMTGGRYDPISDSWAPTSIIGAPFARSGHTSVWTGSRMLTWGGGYVYGSDDGGRYDPVADTWAPLGGSGAPEARYFHSAVWTGNQMVVWGGSGSSQYLNTGGRFDPATASWTPTSTVGAPAGRNRHRAFWTGNTMIVWGGFKSGSSVFGDGGRYDPTSDTWLPLSTVGAPTPATNSSAVWTGSRMIVWGGVIGSSYPQSGGRYDPDSDVWTPTTLTGAPSGRQGHAAVWSGSRMIIWGGASGTPASVFMNSGARYDPVTDSWSPTSTVNAPPAVFNKLPALWVDHFMLYLTGGNGSGSRRYDPVLDVWLPVSALNAPLTKDSTSSVVSTGPLMVVWGGGFQNGSNTGARYDPVGNAWTPTSTIGAPRPRLQHSAVWTGRSMLIWGGQEYAVTGTDGEYVADPDLDADGFNACQGDCDQRAATVYPGAPQTCDGVNNDCSAPAWPSTSGTNEADNDSDGRSTCQGDCNDADPSAFAVPVEVAGITISKPIGGGAGLSWTSQAETSGSGTVYDVVTGSLDDTRDSGSYAGVSCLADDRPSSTYVDERSGPEAGCWYYLVRAAGGCGTASFGDSSIGPDPRDALDASPPCP